jgi:hypothetical protein
MKTFLEQRWGGGQENPSKENLIAALEELSHPDPEHPDTWLSDENGWTVSVSETGLLLLLDPDGTEIYRRQSVSRDEALDLWLLLQKGRYDEIKYRLAGESH